jgi:hypothetical protein
MTERIRGLMPWLLLFAIVGVIELAVRFAIPFALRRVLVVEAVVFLGAGVVSGMLVRRSVQVGWRYALQWALVGAFVLAAVRAGLWAVGVPVARANQIIGLVGVLALGAVWLRRRSQPRAP